MNTIEDLKKSVMSYLEDNETEYAVMINGEWGCGKTYFLKSVIAPYLQIKGKKLIYISLYSLADITEIDNLIVIDLISYLKNNKGFFDTLNKLSDAVLKIFKFDSKAKDLVLAVARNNLLENLNNVVLCFDDLERATVDIEKVLGYINNFVEHRAIKTILICNEAEIHSKSEDYRRTKEKLIGYTFDFKPSIEEVIDQLIEKYQNTFKKIIIDNKSLLINLIQASGVNNLRLLKNFLNISNNIFDHLKNIENTISDVDVYVLRFTFSINTEFNTGRIDFDQLNAWINEGYHVTLIKQNEERKEESYLSSFIQRYYGFNNFSRQITFKSIYNYIIRGYFDKILFEEEVEAIQKIEETPQQLFLNRYFLLSDTDFFKMYREYINALKNDRLSKPTELIKLCQNLIRFSQEGLIPENNEELRDIFKDTIQRQYANKNMEYQDIRGDSFGLFYGEIDNQYYKEIKNLLLKINEDEYEKRLSEEINKLITSLKNNSEEFFREAYKYHTDRLIPIFKYMSVDDLFNVVIHLRNPEIVSLRNFLLNRYETLDIGKFLSEDYQGLKKFSSMLKSYLSNGNKKLSYYLITLLCKAIDETCEKLKA